MSTKQDWLKYYDDDWARNKNINPPEYLSKRLLKLTQIKLAQISAAIVQPPRAKNIFLVEQQPINFIAGFFASVIAEVNLFLCDPGWQRQEWQQVLGLVKPDLILGEKTTIDLIHQLESASGQPAPIVQQGLSSPSLIMIPTGGTSGKLKFAVHSWQTLAASVEGFKSFFACEQINSCCTLPLYHVSGLMQLMRSFLTQGNLTICSYKLITALPFTLDQSAYFISLIPTQLKFLLAESPKWLGET
ncbi:MAG: AMP-binding protein [Cyanobacteria bacterium P01_C01_bin.72]